MPETINCTLRRFNPRRASRGVPAAEVEINGEVLWMDRNDIRENEKLFGNLQGLHDAAIHYATNDEFPARN
jgi:hypothetical protein